MRDYLNYIVLALLLFSSCEEGETVLENEDIIFSNSYPISIPVYEYSDNSGNSWTVNGEASYMGYPDTLSSEPVFAWEDIGIRILTVAIFEEAIEVRGGEIKNVSDIVWQWHSGMKTEKADTVVQFSEGRSVSIQSDGKVIYGSDAGALDVSKNYYWAAWGWGQSGTRILYSTKQLEFHVIN